MRKITAIAAAVAALGLGGTAQSAQFVVNGDFTELSSGLGQFDYTTTVTGWSGNGGYNFVFNTADQSVNGNAGSLSLWDLANGGTSAWNGLAAGPGNFAALDGDYGTAAITQVISGLTVGKTYELSFAYAFGQQFGFDGDTVQNITESLGGQTWTSSNATVPSHGFVGWSTEVQTITATSTSETLSFLAYGNLPVPPFAMVSNVSLIGVPEPAAWTLLILGLAGLGGLARRRRALEPVAAA